MQTLILFFIRNYKLTIILSLGMLIFGLSGMSKLNSESFPAVDFAFATVETRYDGATPEEIETKITKPLEDQIRTVSGLKDVRSVSKSGMSEIFIRVDMDNVNVSIVMTDLQKAVDRVSTLPSDLKDDPIFNEINSEEFPAIEIAVVGDNTGRKRDIIADILKEDLEDNKRVLGVRPVGYLKRQFNIYLDQKKLDQAHIGINEVLHKISSRNVSIPGGDITTVDKIQKLIRIEGKIHDAQELGDIVIRSNFTGNKVTLNDIARIEDGEEKSHAYASYMGKPAVLLVVMKKAGTDTLALVRDVNTVLERYREQYKGEFEFPVFHDEGVKVQNKLDILNSNAISGLVLVVVFLFIFLPGRIGVLASFSLPLAVMATVGFMPLLGMNLNAITILALVIALGMLVDNAVVISENFTRLKIDEKLEPFEAAKKSVEQLWLPITATAMTTIFAFVPMLVTKGIMGQFIKWIPIVVTISLLVSLLESFFLLPMRLVLWGGKVKATNEVKKDWFQGISKKFENMMSIIVARRWYTFIAFGVVIISSFMLMAFGNKFMLFPAEQTEIYLVRVEMPEGSDLTKTMAEVDYLSQEIKAKMGDNVAHIVGRSGGSKMGPTDPKGGSGTDKGLITIYASEYAKYNIHYVDYLKELRTIEPRLAKKVSFEEMVNGPPVGEALNVTFRSNNEQNLNEMLAAVVERLGQVDGIVNLAISENRGPREIELNIDYTKVDRLGLTVNDIGSSIRTAFQGTPISKVTLLNKDVDLNVKLADTYRLSAENISRIKVMDKQGNLVPVSEVATLSEKVGTPEINRFDFKRSKTLTGGVNPEKITSVLANKKLVEIYQDMVKNYPDVSIVFGGESESTKESMESLGEAGMLAAIGIFAVMVFIFNSFLKPFIIMTTIPLGVIGFSVAFFLHGRPISFLALIGIIGLAGIIVNSGIVLISFIEEMKKEGKMGLHEILAKASAIRLRAVLVTSLTTISGLIPTAYGIGGSDSMLVPMTLAMAWGLTSGTILTLVWIPSAYAILEDLIIWRDKFFAKIFADKGKDLLEQNG
jgi:multidrug efflux pump subunit AcrB